MDNIVTVSQKSNHELQSKQNHTNVLNYDEFITHMSKQVEKTLGKTKRADLRTVMDKTAFQRFAKRCRELDKEYCPLLTFHGTGDPDTVNSILENGYLMPGEIIPHTSGQVIPMKHGNYYGDGIYTSTFYDVSRNYSFSDIDCKYQLIVNLVNVGKVHWILPPNSLRITKLKGNRLIQKNIYNAEFGPHVPIGGQYSDGSNTRMHANGYVISATGGNVWPLFVVTINPLSSFKNIIDIVEQPKFSVDDELPRIKFNRVWRDFYVINPPTLSTPNKNIPIHYSHTFLIPTKATHMTAIVNPLAIYVDSIQGKKSLFVYDNKIHFYTVTSGGDTVKNALHGLRKSNIQNLQLALIGCYDKITKCTDDVVHILYIFVDKPTELDVEMVFKKFSFSNGDNVVIKLIFLEKSSGSDPVKVDLIKLKCSLSDFDDYEELCFEIDDDYSLSEIFSAITSEITTVKIDKCEWKIPYPLGAVGQGFVTKFYQQPQWNCSIGKNIPLLYKGSYLQFIKYNDVIYKTSFEKTCDVLCAGEAFVCLLNDFRNYILSSLEKQHLFQNEISGICQSILTELDKRLLEERSKILISKLKKFSYQLWTIFNEFKLYGDLVFDGKWYKRLLGMRFGKRILKRVSKEFSISQLRKEVGIEIDECCDCLIYRNDLLRGAQIIISESAKIEPWLISVKRISNDVFSISDFYLKTEIKIPILDSSELKVNSVIPSANDSRESTKMLLAYTFTRNPYLFLPSQKEALISACFLHCAEECFLLSRKDGDPDQIREMMNNAWKYFDQMSSLSNRNIDKEFVQKLTNETNVQQFLTESYDMASISKLIYVLASEPCCVFFTCSQKYDSLAFALMAESVMRSAKIYLRTQKMSSDECIRKALGIHESCETENFALNLESAKKFTGRFYLRSFTLCSPFALVAALGFLEYYHTNKRDELFLALCEKTLSMRNFLIRHLPNEDGPITQIALYLQGMKYYKSKLRQNISFKDPQKIVSDIVDEQLAIVKLKQNIQKRMVHRSMLKREKLLLEATPYAGQHTMPNVFTWAEVDDLNRNRPQKDQLILLPSGLLKHHCCYPNCSQYLECFESKTDKLKGTRRGLMRHLKYGFVLNNYVPSLHLLTSEIFKNSRSLTLDTYVSLLEKRIYSTSRSSIDWLKNFSNKDSKLKFLYEQYSKIYNS